MKRFAAPIVLLLVAASILGFGMSPESAAKRDVLAYWATGKALVHRASPYDAPAMLAVEKSVGLTDSRPLLMRNPPTALAVVAPLGMLGERPAAIAWCLMLLVCLIASIRLIRGNQQDRRFLIGYCFPPVIACLLAGQIGLLLLLIVTAFFYFLQHRRSVACGCLVGALCGLKPHLLLPFVAAYGVRSIRTRTYLPVVLATLTFAALALLGFLLDPSGWHGYTAMMRDAQIENEFIPSLSCVLRIAISRHAAWIQFIPSAVATVWAVWRASRESWDWQTDGYLVLIISVITAPYAWFTDEAVLLPALLVAMQRAELTQRQQILWACILAAALFGVIGGVTMTSGFYFWTPIAWLSFYLYAERSAPIGSRAARAPEVVET